MLHVILRCDAQCFIVCVSVMVASVRLHDRLLDVRIRLSAIGLM